MDFNKDYYAVLGVLPNAEDFLIKAAYKALSQRYHPDKFKGSKEQAETKMKALNEAYSILSNVDKRKQYDNYLKEQGKQNEYHEEADEPNSSELINEADWLMAVQYVPKLQTLYNNLENFSANLAFNFKLYILKDKAFDKPLALAKKLESEFFSTFFGDDIDIHDFAKFLLTNGHRKAAQELNKAVKLFESRIDSQKIIDNISSKYNVDFYKAKVLFESKEHAIFITELNLVISNKTYMLKKIKSFKTITASGGQMQLVLNFLTSTGNKDIPVFSTINGGVISQLRDELKKTGITYDEHKGSGRGCFIPFVLVVFVVLLIVLASSS